MEYRQLDASGLRVPALSFGTGTFGGQGPLFSAWGQSDETEARRLIDISLDAGVTLFDTADVYSGGASEEILGAAIRGRRDAVLVRLRVERRDDRWLERDGVCALLFEARLSRLSRQANG